jgi:hypothetical protein
MEVKMKATGLWICLYGLCGLLIVGCTPTETVPLSVTRPIAQTTVTDTPAPAIPTNTASPAATPTVTTITLSPAATDPAMPTWTREPSPTPTVTATLTATPPPLSGPVWRIQFRGQPCPDEEGDCSRYSSYLNHVPSEDYIINSDGSGFATLAEAGIFLENYGRFYLFPNSFSPDGSYIAFATSNCIYVSDPAGDNPICLAPDSPFPSGYRFLPDGSCLMTYFRVLEIPFAQVRLEKNCIDQEPEIIGFFDFVDLPDHPVVYELSPQGDVLLAHGRMADGELRLYVQEIDQPTPPHLLFTYPNEDLSGHIVAVRWLPDGSAIEFLLRTQSDNTFYRVSRDGGNITTGVSLPEQFQAELGDWSPDGQQFAFSHVEEDGTKSGLYIIDVQTGEWQQILSDFHMSSTRVRAWLSGGH